MTLSPKVSKIPSSWFASSIASCIACCCMASSKGGHQERALWQASHLPSKLGVTHSRLLLFLFLLKEKEDISSRKYSADGHFPEEMSSFSLTRNKRSEEHTAELQS